MSADQPTGGGWTPPEDPQGQPPYPQQPGAPGYFPSAPAPSQMGPVPAVPGVTLAPWGLRVVAYLIDGIITGLPVGLAQVVYVTTGTPTTNTLGSTTTPSAAGVVAVLIGGLVSLALWIWNRGVRQGAGQSIGKQLIGLRLISERTREPIGTGMALLRDIVHVVDGIFYLGYLWPLWDPKKQTFADKILTTLSVRV